MYVHELAVQLWLGIGAVGLLVPLLVVGLRDAAELVSREVAGPPPAHSHASHPSQSGW